MLVYQRVANIKETTHIETVGDDLIILDPCLVWRTPHNHTWIPLDSMGFHYHWFLDRIVKHGFEPYHHVPEEFTHTERIRAPCSAHARGPNPKSTAAEFPPEHVKLAEKHANEVMSGGGVYPLIKNHNIISVVFGCYLLCTFISICYHKFIIHLMFVNIPMLGGSPQVAVRAPTARSRCVQRWCLACPRWSDPAVEQRHLNQQNLGCSNGL